MRTQHTKKLFDQHFSRQIPEQNAIWPTKQAYLGLGTALIAAPEIKVVATTMEGFDTFLTTFSFFGKGLQISVINSLVYGDDSNKYLTSMPKVLLPINEFSRKLN